MPDREASPIPRERPPTTGEEVAMLRGWLDFHRATLRRKAHGLDTAGLAAALAPSRLTLGGLLHHLAFVEDHWFGHVLLGRERVEPWRDVDWRAEPDWELDAAAGLAPAVLFERHAAAVAASETILDDVLARPDGVGLATRSERTSHGSHVELRWILLHVTQEYARHNGHADLLREAIDGRVGQ